MSSLTTLLYKISLRLCLKSDDDRYANEEWGIDDLTYRINRKGHWEDRMTICCITKDKLSQILVNFKEVKIEYEKIYLQKIYH